MPFPSEDFAEAEAQMRTSQKSFQTLELGNENTQALQGLRGHGDSKTGYNDRVHVSLPVLNR